jgi:uncharacterized protein (TIGR00255 family)
MIKSMTGFGKATTHHGERKIVIEIRSLNSKQFDLSTRLPPIYREKEIEIRGIVKERLDRGKIDLVIYIDSFTSVKESSLNFTNVSGYYRQARSAATFLGATIEQVLAITRLPDALQTRVDELSDIEWHDVRDALIDAIHSLDAFRAHEGKILAVDILERVDTITALVNDIPALEKPRVDAIRQRLLDRIKEWTTARLDENRLEQEIIYYIEKLDITEEKTRLAQHCRYFVDTAVTEHAPGRKLAFIAQEIGREINTIGAKANDADIQKIVVRVKDELEKIKEQTLNLL